MKTLLLVLALALNLRGQGVPGIGGLGALGAHGGGGGGTPTLDTKAVGTDCGAECAGSPPIQTVTLNATAGTVVVFGIFACHDVSCAVASVQADVASVADGTNTYVFDKFCPGPAGHNYGLWIYHIQSKSGGSLTTTVTYASTVGWYGDVRWSSWTGMATSSVLDQTGAGQGTGTTLTATTSGNLGQSSELVFGIGVGANALTIGAGFTALNAGNSLKDEYQVTGTSGATTSATWTQASGDWDACVATFKHL